MSDDGDRDLNDVYAALVESATHFLGRLPAPDSDVDMKTKLDALNDWCKKVTTATGHALTAHQQIGVASRAADKLKADVLEGAFDPV